MFNLLHRYSMKKALLSSSLDCKDLAVKGNLRCILLHKYHKNLFLLLPLLV